MRTRGHFRNLTQFQQIEDFAKENLAISDAKRQKEAMSLLSGKFIAFRNDRLGARINSLINASRLSQDYDAPMSMIWPSHDLVSEELRHPEELFDPDYLKSIRIEGVGFDEVNRVSLQKASLPQNITADTFREKMANGATFLCNEVMGVTVLPWEDPEEMAARLPLMIGEIGFSERVKTAIGELETALAGFELTAYHLRRGDIVDETTRASNVLWPSKYVPRVFYEEHISRMLASGGNRKIVIFSDSDAEVAAFRKMADEVNSLDDLVQMEGLTRIQRDFLEIYAMSRCAEIYAPAASAFSGVAATLGNSQIIPLVDDLGEEGQTKALDNLVHKLEHTRDDFAGQADLGQCLDFMVKHNAKSGEHRRSADILSAIIDEGSDRSYAYDLLARELFRLNDADGMDHLLDVIRDRPVYTEDANALTHCLASLTYLATNQKEKAAKHGQIASWLMPLHPEVRLLYSYLVATGVIPQERGLPHDSQMFILRGVHGGFVYEVAQAIQKLALAPGQEAPQIATVPVIASEIDVRDWEHSFARQYPAFYGQEVRMRQALDILTGLAMKKPEHDIPLASARSTILRQLGNLDKAFSLAKRAADAEPDNALYAKRVADVQTARGDDKASVSNYEAAFELSGGHICHRLDFSKILLETGDKKRAVELLDGLDPQAHDMIGVHLLTADILRRRRHNWPEALTFADRALELAPWTTKGISLRRIILRKLDREDVAAAEKEQLISWNRPSAAFSSSIRKL